MIPDARNAVFTLKTAYFSVSTRTFSPMLDTIISYYYQGHDAVIIDLKLLRAEYFTLENQLMGDLLQSLANFRIKVAFVGTTDQYNRTSQRAFLAEATRSQTVRFYPSLEQARVWLPIAPYGI